MLSEPAGSAKEHELWQPVDAPNCDQVKPFDAVVDHLSVSAGSDAVGHECDGCCMVETC